jgi:hypothetical protein
MSVESKGISPIGQLASSPYSFVSSGRNRISTKASLCCKQKNHAVLVLTKSAALEYAKSGITTPFYFVYIINTISNSHSWFLW